MKNFSWPWALVACFVVWNGSVALSGIIHVDDDPPTSGNDGMSWESAFFDLQDALAVASVGDEIWIAEGTYTPAPQFGDPTMAFDLREGVGVYGGFAGNEVSRDQRNAALYVTVLSGDLNRNDPQLGDNSHRVVKASNVTAATVLDGVTVRAANGPAEGGGIWIDSASPVILDCRFMDNRANSGAGAHLDHSSSPRFDRCRFEGNEATSTGGAMRCQVESNAQIRACWFVGNTARSYGGALSCSNGSSLEVSECIFEANFAGASGYSSEGGAVFSAHEGTDPSFTDCRFTGNAVYPGPSSSGGAAFSELESSPSFVRCVFDGNSARIGGALYFHRGEPSVRDCSFRSNQAFRQLSTPGSGAALFCGSTSPLIVRSDFDGNYSDGWAGAIYMSTASPTLVSCGFRGNRSDRSGGALYSTGTSGPTIVNGVFIGNLAEEDGGAIYSTGGSSVPSLYNCSIVSNVAMLDGGGLRLTSGSIPNVFNSILWGNADSQGGGEEAQIRTTGGGVIIEYSRVEGWSGTFGGIANSGADPLIADADGPDDVIGTADDDARVLPGSSCIDAGTNARLVADWGDLDDDGDTAEETPRDVGGALRRTDDPDTDPDPGNGLSPIVDIGAHEYSDVDCSGLARGDVNRDGLIDRADLHALVVLLQTGVVDIEDLCTSDLDQNERVDEEDLHLLIDIVFRRSCWRRGPSSF